MEKFMVILSVVIVLIVITYPLHKIPLPGMQPTYYCDYDSEEECNALYMQRFGRPMVVDRIPQDPPELSDAQIADNLRQMREIRYMVKQGSDALHSQLDTLDGELIHSQRNLDELDRLNLEQSLNHYYK